VPLHAHAALSRTHTPQTWAACAALDNIAAGINIDKESGMAMALKRGRSNWHNCLAEAGVAANNAVFLYGEKCWRQADDNLCIL